MLLDTCQQWQKSKQRQVSTALSAKKMGNVGKNVLPPIYILQLNFLNISVITLYEQIL